MSKDKKPSFGDMPVPTRKRQDQCRVPGCEAQGVRYVGRSLLCEEHARQQPTTFGGSFDDPDAP